MARAPKTSALHQDRAGFLAARIDALTRDQDAARKSRSWVAVRQLGQDLDRAHLEFVGLQDRGSRVEQSPEEQVAEILALVRDHAHGFPEEDVEQLYQACCERLGLDAHGPTLELVG